MKNETGIEDKFRVEIEAWGRRNGIVVKCVKFTSPGNRGWPDRMVLWSGGGQMFIEFKKPDKEPRQLQYNVMKELQDIGHEARWYDDWRKALAEVTTYISSKTGANPWNETDRELTGYTIVPPSGEGKNRHCTKGIFSSKELGHGRCSACGGPIAGHYN